MALTNRNTFLMNNIVDRVLFSIYNLAHEVHLHAADLTTTVLHVKTTKTLLGEFIWTFVIVSTYTALMYDAETDVELGKKNIKN